jgi:hypothetical protein
LTPPEGVFTRVDAGYNHTCAIKSDGALACWGWNDYGIATPPEGGFTQVSAGGMHSCAIKTDGTLQCWGNNLYGQQLYNPPIGTFMQISAGGFHTCGIKTDGMLQCWGSNAYGQMNNLPGGAFTEVSAGWYHACGVRPDGTVQCWGDNSYGQLNNIPTSTFTQISTGGFHACGIKPDGTLECWGSNSYGQSTPPAGIFTQVSAGYAYTCGVKLDGTLQCWGDNWAGQAPRVTVTPGLLPEGTIGVAYTQTLSGSGGTSPYTFSVVAGALPNGLEFNAATGVLSGVPTTAGTFNFTIQAIDSYALPFSRQQVYAVTIGWPKYQFGSFKPPMDNPPVLNLAHAGQTIPLKWQVLDSSGNPVTDLSSANVKVTVETLASPPCETAGTTPNLSEEQSAGGTGLKNLGDGNYQWNWKSPASYADSCKILKLDLGEGPGNEHIAWFQFK